MNIIEVLNLTEYFKIMVVLNIIEYLKNKDAYILHLSEGTIYVIQCDMTWKKIEIINFIMLAYWNDQYLFVFTYWAANTLFYFKESESVSV